MLLQISESESPDWESYMLEVEGHTGGVQVFSNSTKLHLDLRGVSTFIQTDKVNYLPEQTVKIRAVSIRSDGRPFVSPVDIIIRVRVMLKQGSTVGCNQRCVVSILCWTFQSTN